MTFAPRPPGGSRGVTLVELIIAIAVLAILLALAVPSFEFVRNVNRLSASSNDLVAALQLARMEAIRQNARVVFCRSDDGTSCSNAAGAWAGWMVAADENNSGTFGDIAAERLRTGTTAAGITINASPALSALGNVVTFRSDGFAYDGAAPMTASIGACLATTTPAENRRRVSIRTGGRVSVVRENGGGVCNQPAN